MKFKDLVTTYDNVCCSKRNHLYNDAETCFKLAANAGNIQLAQDAYNKLYNMNESLRIMNRENILLALNNCDLSFMKWLLDIVDKEDISLTYRMIGRYDNFTDEYKNKCYKNKKDILVNLLKSAIYYNRPDVIKYCIENNVGEIVINEPIYSLITIYEREHLLPLLSGIKTIEHNNPEYYVILTVLRCNKFMSLYEKGTIKLTDDLIETIIYIIFKSIGDLNILKMLYNSYPHLFNNVIINSFTAFIAINGFDHILEWVLSIWKIDSNLIKLIIMNATINRHLQVILTLEHYGYKDYNAVMVGAIKNNYTDIQQWVIFKGSLSPEILVDYGNPDDIFDYI
jgi:hypothetical protein